MIIGQNTNSVVFSKLKEQKREKGAGDAVGMTFEFLERERAPSL